MYYIFIYVCIYFLKFENSPASTVQITSTIADDTFGGGGDRICENTKIFTSIPK